MAARQFHLNSAWLLQHVLLAMLVFSTGVDARCRCRTCPTPPPGPPIAPPVEPPVTPPVPVLSCSDYSNTSAYTDAIACFGASSTPCDERVITCASTLAAVAGSPDAEACLTSTIGTSIAADCGVATALSTCCGNTTVPVVQPLPLCALSSLVEAKECIFANLAQDNCLSVALNCSAQLVAQADTFEAAQCLFTTVAFGTAATYCNIDAALDVCCTALPQCNVQQQALTTLEVCSEATIQQGGNCSSVAQQCSAAIGLVAAGNAAVDLCISTFLPSFNTTDNCNVVQTALTCCAPYDPVTPVAPPVTPPVAPVVPSITCSNNNEITAVLLDCQTECGATCETCGSVFQDCLLRNQLTTNASLSTCLTVLLDFLPVSGGCPYNVTLNTCCNDPTPTPPVAPPVTPSGDLCTSDTTTFLQASTCFTADGDCGTEVSQCVQQLYAVASFNVSLLSCLTTNIAAATGSCLTAYNDAFTACCDSQTFPLFAATAICPVIAGDIETTYGCIETNNVSTCLLRSYACRTSTDFVSNSTAGLTCIFNGLAISDSTSDACNFTNIAAQCCDDPAVPPTTCATNDTIIYNNAVACIRNQAYNDTCPARADACIAELTLLGGGSIFTGTCLAEVLAQRTTTGCDADMTFALQSCCGSEATPLPATETCPLPLIDTSYAYACVTNQTIDTSCGARLTWEFCGVFVNALSNDSTATACLLSGLGDSTNLTDCDFYTVLDSCCNIPPSPEAPTAPPGPPIAPPVEPPVTPVAPPVNLCPGVRQLPCVTNSSCLQFAPVCGTQLGYCQVLRGGSCRVDVDCFTGAGMTCDTTSCTCVGGAQDACADPFGFFLDDLKNAYSNCIQSQIGGTCSERTRGNNGYCGARFLGNGGPAILDADTYSNLIQCLSVESNTFDNNCNVDNCATQACAL